MVVKDIGELRCKSECSNGSNVAERWNEMVGDGQLRR